jgi:taurine dioxygenase
VNIVGKPIAIEATTVKRLAPTFAAELAGFEITEQSISKRKRWIYELYLEHKVLVLHDQDLSPRTFAAFGRVFGEPEQHHVIKLRHPDEPTLTYLSNQDELDRNPVMKYSGDGWHSDYSYKLVPASATMLLGIDIPDEGGDTLFADAQAAFEDLPEKMKQHLRTLRVRHQYRWSPDKDDPWARWKYIGQEERDATPEITHPLVRRHPDTGRETLFLQPRVIGSVIGIAEMDEAASNALVDELIAHITSEKFVYRHRWQRHDVVVWDNRCLLHSGTTKTLSEEKIRRLLRLTTMGSAVTPSDPAVGMSRLAPVDENIFGDLRIGC